MIARYIEPLLPVKTAFSPGGHLRRPVRAVVFDVYGTLFVSASGENNPEHLEPDRRTFLRRLLQENDLQVTVEWLLGALQHEIELQHVSKKKLGIAYPEVDILQVWQQVLPLNRPQDIRRFALEFEFIVNPVYPMPHLAGFLAVCAHQTAAMGIISNAQFYTPYLFEWLVEADLSQLGFDPELVLLSYQLGKAKPSLELFEKMAVLLDRRGIESDEVLYVGNDMLKDIYPANACGFQSALFAGDERSLRLHRDDFRCKRLQPDLIITQLDQLLPHLQEER